MFNVIFRSNDTDDDKVSTLIADIERSGDRLILTFLEDNDFTVGRWLTSNSDHKFITKVLKRHVDNPAKFHQYVYWPTSKIIDVNFKWSHADAAIGRDQSEIQVVIHKGYA